MFLPEFMQELLLGGRISTGDNRQTPAYVYGLLCAFCTLWVESPRRLCANNSELG